MTHCAWCGKDLKNHPPKYLWADHNLNVVDERTYENTRIPFCSEECRKEWILTKWMDRCIVCGNMIKSEAPGNKEIIRNDIIFYACPEHKDRNEEIESLIEDALEDIGDWLQ